MVHSNRYLHGILEISKLMEKRIPLKLPEYQFEEEDIKLSLSIKGLKCSRVVHPKPFGPVFHFEISELSTFQDISDFVNSVPHEFAVVYFRPFDVEKSVAGTIVTVQKDEYEYCYRNRSHGQDITWKPITKEALLEELYTFRSHQSFGTISVSRKIKKQ